MELGFFGYYLIFINVIGFIAYAINNWLYANTAESQIDTVLTIVALLGGSAGILLYILLFDRKAVKGNMMSVRNLFRQGRSSQDPLSPRDSAEPSWVRHSEDLWEQGSELSEDWLQPV